MIQVLLVIHLILAVAIIGLVLLQRSEGGGLGMGSGGGGLGSFATPQATASVMNRVTWYCAGAFFITSLLLSILYNHAASKGSIIDQLDKPVAAITAPVDSKVDAKVKEKASADKPATTKKSEPTVPVTP